MTSRVARTPFLSLPASLASARMLRVKDSLAHFSVSADQTVSILERGVPLPQRPRAISLARFSSRAPRRLAVSASPLNRQYFVCILAISGFLFCDPASALIVRDVLRITFFLPVDDRVAVDPTIHLACLTSSSFATWTPLQKQPPQAQYYHIR